MNTTLILILTATFAQVQEAPLPVEFQPAFPQLQWTGWSPVSEEGLATPLRPILLTHAGDGTNRVFVPTQAGRLFYLTELAGPLVAECN